MRHFLCFRAAPGHTYLVTNSLRTDTLLCVLAHTNDPSLAERLADELAPLVADATTKVTFSSSWVRSRQRSCAELSAFAVRHCDDEAVLHDAALKEKRIKVLCALLENPHLATTLRHGFIGHPNRLVASRATRTLPWSFADCLDQFIIDLPSKRSHAFSRSDLADLLHLLRQHPSPKNVDLALTRLAARGEVRVVIDYLDSLYAVGSSDSFDVWSSATLSPIDVLALVPRHLLHFVAYHIATVAVDHIGNAIPFDLPLAHLMVCHANPENHLPSVNGLHPPRVVFIDEAVDFLLGIPAWAPLLRCHQLDRPHSLRLLGQLCKASSPAKYLGEFYNSRQHAFNLLNPSLVADAQRTPSTKLPITVACDVLINSPYNPREMLSLLLDADQRTPSFLTNQNTHALLTALDSPDDPLLVRLLNSLDSLNFLYYLLGSWCIKGRPVLPDVNDIPTLTARVQHTSSYTSHVRVTLPAFASSQYFRAILESLPGIASTLIDDPRAASIIYETLEAAPSMEYAIDQFIAQASHTTLSHLRQTFDTLCRSSLT